MRELNSSRHSASLRAGFDGERMERGISAAMRFAAALVLLFLATAAGAQVVAANSRGIAVAHDGRVDLFDRRARRVLWSAPGLANASRIITGGDRIAVLDAFGNGIEIVDLTTGRATSLEVGETPVDGVFAGQNLYILERDARVLERIGADGARTSVALAADPAFLREANGSLYVYSRVAGVVQEISPATMKLTRNHDVAPFASDFETDGRTGFLVYPRRAKVLTFSLATMRTTGELASGVVPVDLSVTHKASALAATTLSVADPSAKRVWIAEGTQSVTAAVARGFVRGLLGLGLFRARSSDFPTGVDRIVARGSTAVVYDSATRTLYKLRGSKGTAIARDVAPQAFALTADGILVWGNDRLHLIR